MDMLEMLAFHIVYYVLFVIVLLFMGWNVPFLKRNCFHIQLKCHQQIEMSAFDVSLSQTIRIID